MDVTKPYEFIGFGAMDVTRPYKFIGFGVGVMDVTKPFQMSRITTTCNSRRFPPKLFRISATPEIVAVEIAGGR